MTERTSKTLAIAWITLCVTIPIVCEFKDAKVQAENQIVRQVPQAIQIPIEQIRKQGEVTASYNISPMTNPFVGTDAVAAYHWHNGYLNNNAKRLEALSKKVKALEAEKDVSP